MKKVVLIFLVFAFLFELTGTVFIFKISQYAIRKEIKKKIKAGLAQEDLVIFSFSDKELADLNWEHSREFHFRGKMFDVVRRSDKNDQHVLYCISDDQESRLFADLDNITSKKMNRNLPFKVPFNELVWILSHYLFDNCSFSFPPLPSFEFNFKNHLFFSVSEFIDLPSIPPELVRVF